MSNENKECGTAIQSFLTQNLLFTPTISPFCW